MLLLFHTGHAGAVSALGLFQAHMLLFHVLVLRSVIVFFKHGLGFDCLELGLEIGDVMPMGAAIGTTTGIGELIAIVLALLTWRAPVAQYCEQGCIALSVGTQRTSYPSLLLPSSLSWGQHQHDRTLRSNEEGDRREWKCRRQERRDHDHFACASESLPSQSALVGPITFHSQQDRDLGWGSSGQRRAHDSSKLQAFEKIDLLLVVFGLIQDGKGSVEDDSADGSRVYGRRRVLQ